MIRVGVKEWPNKALMRSEGVNLGIKWVKVGILALSLSGCALVGLSAVTNSMTPEQIAAHEKAGKDVYGCFTVGGPPPIGGTTWIVVPKGAKPNLSFGANCQLIRAEAGADK